MWPIPTAIKHLSVFLFPLKWNIFWLPGYSRLKPAAVGWTPNGVTDTKRGHRGAFPYGHGGKAPTMKLNFIYGCVTIFKSAAEPHVAVTFCLITVESFNSSFSFLWTLQIFTFMLSDNQQTSFLNEVNHAKPGSWKRFSSSLRRTGQILMSAWWLWTSSQEGRHKVL